MKTREQRQQQRRDWQDLEAEEQNRLQAEADAQAKREQEINLMLAQQASEKQEQIEESWSIYEEFHHPEWNEY